MAVVSEMLIRIAADTAQLRTQMEQAKASVQTSFEGMEKAINLAKTAFVAFAGVASVAAFGKMIGGIVDAMGAMHDLAQTTGMSVAALGQFKAIGALSETSIDSIASAALKLAKNMSLADEEGKGAALAIRALGIDFEKFKSLSPDQQMLEAAKALNKFEDGADKSAAAMMLFGKEGARLLPFLKDLGDSADEVNSKLTEQQVAAKAAAAAMADAYGDNLIKIRKNSEGWKKDLAEGMLPVMYETSEAFLQLFGGSGGLRDQLKALVADGTIAKWGRVAVDALSYVVDGVQIAVRAFNSLIIILGNLVLASGAALQGEFKKAGQFLADIPKEIADQWGAKTLGQTFRDRMQDLKGVQVEAEGTKEKLNLSEVLKANEEAKKREEEATKAAAAAQKAALAEYERAVKAGGELAKTIDNKNESLKQELALGRALTPVEKELLKLDQDLKTGKVILTTAHQAELREKIKLGTAMEDEIALRKEIKKQHEAEVDALYKHAATLETQTAKLKDENYAMRNGKQALDDLEVSRLKEERATMAEIVAREDLLLLCNAETEAHRKTLAALDDLIAAREDGVHLKAAKEAADEWKKTADSISNSLTDALMRGFESGKGFAQNLRDTLKNLFNSLVLKPIIQPIAQGASGTLLSFMGMGSANASTGGAGGSVSSLLSGGMNFLNGNTISAGASGMYTRAGDYLSTSSNNTLAGMGDFMQNNPEIGSYLGMAGNAAAGYGLGKLANNTISGGYSVGKGYNTFQDIGSAVAGAILGPVGGAVVGAVTGLVNRAFGTKLAGQGIEGNFSQGGFQGNAYKDYKGGWFRSDKTERSTLDGPMADALGAGATAIYAQVKSYAEALALPADEMKNVSYQMKVALTEDAKANQQAIADAVSGYGDALVGAFTEQLAPFQRAGEKLVETLQRLSIIQQVSESMNSLGGAFSNFARSSVEARESVIQLAGGIDALIKKAGGFVGNYYSSTEQGGLTARSVQQGLEAAGFTPDQIAGLTGRGEFRALLESLDVNTSTGQQQFVALLNLQDQFASVSTIMGEQKLTLDELAKQAPTVAALDKLFAPTKKTSDDTETMVTGIDKSNQLLESVVGAVNGTTAAVEAGLATVASAVGSAVAAASAAASQAASAAAEAAAASKASASALDNVALLQSQQSYVFDVGGYGGGE